MKEEIYNFIKKKKGGVSFIELEEQVEGFKGDKYLVSGEYKNLIVWQNVSQQAIDSIGELLAEERITAQSTTPLVYLIDGGRYLNFPIAKKSQDYKNPRWMPCVLNLKN